MYENLWKKAPPLLKKGINKDFVLHTRTVVRAMKVPIKKGTKLFEIYQKKLIYERHQHRYEFNNEYREKFEKSGMIISGTSPDEMLVEAIEISNHPFFVGTQFHLEYQSHPFTPHPLLVNFIKACLSKRKAK